MESKTKYSLAGLLIGAAIGAVLKPISYWILGSKCPICNARVPLNNAVCNKCGTVIEYEDP